MTPKTIIFGLCLCVILCIATIAFLFGYCTYLAQRNNRLETQSEAKTELICALNSRLEEAQKDYNELEKDYEKLRYKERKKENDRG